MTPLDLAAAARRSEELIRPGIRPLAAGEETGRAKVLLARDAAMPISGRALALVPCDSDDAWADYADRRVEVEAGFGLDEEQARALVGRTRERGRRLGLRLWLATGPDGAPVGAVGAFPVTPVVARLQEVDVFPGHRGRGLGDALLEAVRRRLADDGDGHLVVGADEDDWPLGWYHRRGFTPVGVRVPTASASPAPPRS